MCRTFPRCTISGNRRGRDSSTVSGARYQLGHRIASEQQQRRKRRNWAAIFMLSMTFLCSYAEVRALRSLAGMAAGRALCCKSSVELFDLLEEMSPGIAKGL